MKNSTTEAPTRDCVISIRLAPKERAALDAAAAKERRLLADWARLALLDAAAASRKP